MLDLAGVVTNYCIAEVVVAVVVVVVVVVVAMLLLLLGSTFHFPNDWFQHLCLVAAATGDDADVFGE